MWVLLRNHIARHVLSWHEQKHRSVRGRRKKLSIGYILERIFFVCKTGCQWHNLHVDNGSWKTVWHYFNMWSKARLFEHNFYTLASNMQSQKLIVDTTFVKNVLGQDVLGRNPTDRGRKATKVSLLTNERGSPLAVRFHQGNKSDQHTLGILLEEAQRKAPRAVQGASVLLADKGYDSASNRHICKRFGCTARIAQRGIAAADNERYVVEQTFGILDLFRRIRVRYERHIRNFKSFHFLALAGILARRL